MPVLGSLQQRDTAELSPELVQVQKYETVRQGHLDIAALCLQLEACSLPSVLAQPYLPQNRNPDLFSGPDQTSNAFPRSHNVGGILFLHGHANIEYWLLCQYHQKIH
mmetsp:Transcript_10811/g.32236  ORF Transcript_10811/g.32236 Transcript_10811/m.32236 type:complete len:107 (-) Transcript_10811:3931-4251(-)